MSLSGYQKWECLVGLPSILYYLYYIEFIRGSFDNIATALLGTGSMLFSIIGIFVVLLARAFKSIPKIFFTAMHQEWRALILYICNATVFFILIYLHVSANNPILWRLPKICLHQTDCNDNEKITYVLFLIGICLAVYRGWRLRRYDGDLEGVIFIRRKIKDLPTEKEESGLRPCRSDERESLRCYR